MVKTSNEPFLMRQDIAANLFFLALDKVDVRQHAVSLEACRKFGCTMVNIPIFRYGDTISVPVAAALL